MRHPKLLCAVIGVGVLLQVAIIIEPSMALIVALAWLIVAGVVQIAELLGPSKEKTDEQ